ncbi:uncharacterized protein B0I36DRAFT_363799 [Microdochium trichocladiopsis]|uniref:Uncharacterized protein n=1 Tax=Microdochium trichocladiopsis TaxID=1682393 RepID=A0A9P8Y706_9PEZI|nr:uncharacterized protein B0I36DRAFT_363799 [Microdochium trichocladiopsis]KAH7029227.1 hypothetical protein B0I36DRAFT_363799 [Microdochium trichocladiopsis]
MASKSSPTTSKHGNPPKNLRPLGGTKFSYSRNLRPEDLSPASSDDDEDADEKNNALLDAGSDDSEDAEDEDEDESESDDDSESSDKDDDDEADDEEQELGNPASPPAPPPSHRVPPPYMDYTRIATTITIVTDHLIIEDLGDYELGSEDGEVLLPYEFEYPDSEPSRSRSRGPRELDPAFQRNFADLNPFDDTDDDLDDNDEFERHRQRQRQERRIRRMKSGSISKRTVSERGSDSDREDVLPYYEPTDSGPVFRRTRRKTDRHSMQFSGQFPERIEELKEPNSDDEIIFEDAELFARELPFWTFMDVDSE